MSIKDEKTARVKNEVVDRLRCKEEPLGKLYLVCEAGLEDIVSYLRCSEMIYTTDGMERFMEYFIARVR
ncbi:MAG: hypothetical protein N2746_02095 [Deltaproteobacteria bacterium]|nr:hypothetical protein [Deltaproteobacteria bacterium]